MKTPLIPAEDKSPNNVNNEYNNNDDKEKKQKKIPWKIKQWLARKISSNVILSVIPFPAIFLLFPIFLLILGIIIAFLLVVIIVLLSLLILLSPALILKRICPKLHLTGYQPITDVAYHHHDDTTTNTTTSSTEYEATTNYNNNNNNNNNGSNNNKHEHLPHAIPTMPLLFKAKYENARCNNEIPMLTEVRAFLSLSDFVYMYIDFRKLVMLGKMPVDFKYIMLECDTMNQSDIIRGVPHERPAYGPNGEGGAGILPFTLIATVLRFLNAESMRHRVENINDVLTGGQRRQREMKSRALLSDGVQRGKSISTFGGTRNSKKSIRFLNGLRSRMSIRLLGGGGAAAAGATSTTISATEDLEIGGNGGYGARRRSIAITGKMESHLLEKTDLTTQDIKQMGSKGENDVYGGLAMFEKLFLKSLKHVTPDCGSHRLGGSLCSSSGLHGMQCFLDSLVREAENGDVSCEELIDTLTNEDIDEDYFDAEVDKIGKLMLSVARAGNIFKEDSSLYSTIMATKENDQRIIWTNDRMGEAECVFIIVVSLRMRRVTVIFRGTTTVSDIIANADFGITTVPDPTAEDYPNGSDLIEVNNGYVQYLLTERDDTGLTKFDEIANRVEEFGNEMGEGGYSLFVTGHSMGGALAAIFGFYASTDRRFAQKDNPVRIFTFASAIPGRVSFAKAFQHQEKAGLLQHLRISNDNDIVPLAHPQSELTFAHTGVSLSLHEDRNLPSIKYVQDPDWWGTWTANFLTNLWLNSHRGVGKNHSTINYAKRYERIQTEMNEKGMGGLTLNDLYAAYLDGSAPPWSQQCQI